MDWLGLWKGKRGSKGGGDPVGHISIYRDGSQHRKQADGTWKMIKPPTARGKQQSLFDTPKRPAGDLPLFAFSAKQAAAEAAAKKAAAEAAAAKKAAAEAAAAAAKAKQAEQAAAEAAQKAAEEEARKKAAAAAKAKAAAEETKKKPIVRIKETKAQARKRRKSNAEKEERRRHKEVGVHVWGSRADRAKFQIRDISDIDLAHAGVLITKARLKPEWDEDAYRESGGQAGGWYMINYVMKAISARPKITADMDEDAQRKLITDYADGLDLLVKTLERCKDTGDVVLALDEIASMTEGWDEDRSGKTYETKEQALWASNASVRKVRRSNRTLASEGHLKDGSGNLLWEREHTEWGQLYSGMTLPENDDFLALPEGQFPLNVEESRWWTEQPDNVKAEFITGRYSIEDAYEHRDGRIQTDYPHGTNSRPENRSDWRRVRWIPKYPRASKIAFIERTESTKRRPKRDSSGNIVLDASGNEVHEYVLTKKRTPEWGQAINAQMEALGPRIDILLHGQKDHYGDRQARDRNKAFDTNSNKAHQLDRVGWSKAKESLAEEATTKKKRRFSWTQAASGKPERVGGPAGVTKADGPAMEKEFGLFNIQYGEYASDKDRDFHLVACHNAMRDLSDVLGIDAKTLSLNGRLSIGFGARGSGPAKAHYEAGSKIINITKFAGGGSLAHEWGHFLDNVLKEGLSEGQSAKTRYLSQHDPVKSGSTSDPELVNAVLAVRQAMMAGDPAAEERRVAARAAKTEAALATMDARQKFADYSPFADKDPAISAAAQAMRELGREMTEHAEHQPKYGSAGWARFAEERTELTAAYNEAKVATNVKREQLREEYEAARQKETAAVRALNEATREAQKPSNYMESALAMSGGKAEAYYARTYEMFARGFEAFVQDELEENGRRNSYLVDGTRQTYRTGKIVNGSVPDELLEKVPEVKAAREELRQARHRKKVLGRNAKATKRLKVAEANYHELVREHSKGAAGHAQPYPQGAERERINTAFTELLKVLRDKDRLKKAMEALAFKIQQVESFG